MSHERLVQSAKRVIEFTRSGTLPLAPDVMRVPSRTYLDPDRWQLEIDRIFRRMPLVLGFSCEVAAPHSYRSLDVLGVPVLLVRGGDGVLRSFVNSCSHRGAIVVPEGSGVARRFTCPYHAWNYDTEGALVGILDRDTFGDIDVDCHGLTPLPVEERAGIVFGGVVPGTSFDLDLQLGGLSLEGGEGGLGRRSRKGAGQEAGEGRRAEEAGDVHGTIFSTRPLLASLM